MSKWEQSRAVQWYRRIKFDLIHKITNYRTERFIKAADKKNFKKINSMAKRKWNGESFLHFMNAMAYDQRKDVIEKCMELPAVKNTQYTDPYEGRRRMLLREWATHCMMSIPVFEGMPDMMHFLIAYAPDAKEFATRELGILFNKAANQEISIERMQVAKVLVGYGADIDEAAKSMEEFFEEVRARDAGTSADEGALRQFKAHLKMYC